MPGFPVPDGSGPLPDTRTEFLAWIAIVIVVGAWFVSNPRADSAVRFAATDTQAFLFASGNGEGFKFTREQIGFMAEASKDSIGSNPTGDERLFCFKARNRRVTSLSLIQSINESTLTSISGACITRRGSIDGTVHTQPGGNFELSEEDRNLESSIKYSCVLAEEPAVSPVTKRVDGIKCWQVTGGVENPGFNEVAVKAVG